MMESQPIQRARVRAERRERRDEEFADDWYETHGQGD
jgi:hypothetical protein